MVSLLEAWFMAACYDIIKVELILPNCCCFVYKKKKKSENVCLSI